MAEVEQLLRNAMSLLREGRIAQTETLCREALVQTPDEPGVLHLLGCILHEYGRSEEAVHLLRRASELNPQAAEYQHDLGNALLNVGRLAEAETACREAIRLRPEFAPGFNNLGTILLRQGRGEEAIDAFRRATELDPHSALMRTNLAGALRENGRPAEAIQILNQVIQLDPNYADAYSNLADALRMQGRREESLATAQCALQLAPQDADAFNSFANALKDLGRIDDAVNAYRQAIRFRPRFATAHTNLGTALWALGRIDDAVRAYQSAIEHDPHCADAYNNLANLLKVQSRLDEAIPIYRRALELRPDPSVHSNLLLALNYHGASDRESLSVEHRKFGEQYESPLRAPHQPHDNDRSPDRGLKIGYISGDFREHPVGRFIRPLLANHNRQNFHVACYCNAPHLDSLGEELRTLADRWSFVHDLSDEQLSARIREDRIDVLIDLSGHTAGNRLLVFARKPAPVQITYLGYSNTTGLTSMDYAFTDRHLTPADYGQYCTEQLLQVPSSYVCYQPTSNAPVAETPAQRNGFVTFGCMNSPAKLSTAALRAWAQILDRLPSAQLLLHADPAAAGKIRSLLPSHADRLQFVGMQKADGYFETFSRIDVALDPFPYNGGTTTCDSLWMGVPVITFAGAIPCSRTGLSILFAATLDEFVADSVEAYVDRAVSLASDIPALAKTRQVLRGRLSSSPLMNAALVTRDIENAFRAAWRTWCETAPFAAG